jgi:putative sterol carrier protein
MAKFYTKEWLPLLVDKLNTDPSYEKVAKNWEWDLLMVLEPSGAMKERHVLYMDLWHGKCRSGTELASESEKPNAAFTLKAPYDNFAKVVAGKLDPMQAMLTRKLGVKGNMGIMLRNVPSVMDFVRCCRDVTDGFV